MQSIVNLIILIFIFALPALLGVVLGISYAIKDHNAKSETQAQTKDCKY